MSLETTACEGGDIEGVQVTYLQFCKRITDDFGIDLYQKLVTRFDQFPIKNGKRKINSSYDAIIVDLKGGEHPYMFSQNPAVRNDEKLVEFDFIYVIRPKPLEQILTEVGLKLKSKKCRISEGGGWYTNGVKYYYKDITCEI
jgi:hypothetical protein